MEVIRISLREQDRHKMSLLEIDRQNKKRCRTMDLHEWTDDDTILCFFYTKFGTDHIWLKTDEQICDFIGTTIGSLVKQSMNFRFLMGFQTKVLSDYSKLQHLVYEMFDSITFYEFYCIVKNIIKQDENVRRRIFVDKGLEYENFTLYKVS